MYINKIRVSLVSSSCKVFRVQTPLAPNPIGVLGLMIDRNHHGETM